jgi:hypothetical protein
MAPNKASNLNNRTGKVCTSPSIDSPWMVGIYKTDLSSARNTNLVGFSKPMNFKPPIAIAISIAVHTTL